MNEIEMPHHHKKKHSEIDATEDDSDYGYLDYVNEALETLSEELMDRECYEQFADEKCWRYIDVLKASLQQTVDKDGIVEYPKLSAILLSPSYGPLIRDTLKGTDKDAQMGFLLEAYDFYVRFCPKLGHKTISAQDRKEMTAVARKIFESYIVKADMELPKRVKNEIYKIIHSPAGRMTHTLFQIAGAWVYNRITNSWIREVNSMILWADHDFDNESSNAKAMEQIFDVSIIAKNPVLSSENLNLVPHPDDVLGNPKLMECTKR